jgi:phosphoglycolate/pyridoxal phosphate phosphatase family enzyme
MVDLANYEVILLDCDGVIFEGEHALPGSIEALNYLESLGKRLYFVTNNASKSRETNALKLQGLGYSAKVEQIYGTSYAAPIYLRRNSPDISHVFAIGSNEFKQELKRAGLQVTSASDIPGLTTENTQTIRPDPSIQAVVSALSLNFTYMEGLYASLCIQNGAEFISCNYDAFLPFTPFNLPGSGCILAFLETATQKKAKIVGKPERFFFDLIAEKEELVDKSKFLMVGDRIDTDILFGVNSDIHTALVLTGASSRTDVAKYDYKPTYVVDSLATLVWPSHYS